MEERQLPFPDGTIQPPTLISVLRQAFASKMSCHVAEVTAKMWEVLSGTIFDRIDDEAGDKYLDDHFDSIHNEDREKCIVCPSVTPVLGPWIVVHAVSGVYSNHDRLNDDQEKDEGLPPWMDKEIE